MVDVALWACVAFWVLVFSVFVAEFTLWPKYKKGITIFAWICVGLITYGIIMLAYFYQLYIIASLVLYAVTCFGVCQLYQGSVSSKLFVALLSGLIANVSNYTICLILDVFLGGILGIIQDNPYATANVLLFIGIKIVIYGGCLMLYVKYIRRQVCDVIEILGGKLGDFVVALVISVLAFQAVNVFTSKKEILPHMLGFFFLYFALCSVFVVQFVLLFYAITQNAASIKNTAELNLATNIQKSMLPCVSSIFGESKLFDIDASMVPAKEVGGDFYDFFMIDETHLAIVVADVSGKGLPAAMFMVIGKTLIKEYSKQERDLGQVFRKVNNILCEDNREGFFITAFEGVLDLETGEFCYVNAGHEAPYICRKNEEFELYKVPAGFVLAGMENMEYRSGRLALAQGDKIFLYTDGVSDSLNIYNELYGKERLREILIKNSQKSPAEILLMVKQDIDKFVGIAPRSDDITMLCLEYKSGIKCHKENENERIEA